MPPQGDLNPQQKKYAVINGDNTTAVEIVAAVAGKKIRVLSYVLSVSAATTMLWQSASTAKSGAIHFVGTALVPYSSGYNPAGHLETAVAEALNLKSSANVSFDGHVCYIEV